MGHVFMGSLAVPLAGDCVKRRVLEFWVYVGHYPAGRGNRSARNRPRRMDVSGTWENSNADDAAILQHSSKTMG